MKTISKCPACGSVNLEQDFISKRIPSVIGGEHTITPMSLDGCHCKDCGTKNIFNKEGQCPSCEGSGKFSYQTVRCGNEVYSSLETCPTCNGRGIL